jgi:DinB superfamily
MRFVSSGLSLLLACGLVLGGFASGDPHMTAEEKTKMLGWMRDSHAATLRALEELSDKQLNFKPAPDKWSVLEVAEHIWMAEGLLFAMVEKSLAAPPNPDWETKTKGKSEFLESVMVGRKGKATAPENIVPSGKLARQDLIAKLKAARAKTTAFAETTKAPLKSHTQEHPFPIFNTLNAYQWLIYIPLHNFRHNKQIEEVMAHPNFPKSN